MKIVFYDENQIKVKIKKFEFSDQCPSEGSLFLFMGQWVCK